MTEPENREVKNEICRLARNEKPKGETHWSSRTLAKRVGIPHTKVSQCSVIYRTLVLHEYGLKPHITITSVGKNPTRLTGNPQCP